MHPDMFFPQGAAKRPTSQLGGVQHDIFFSVSVMKVIHRQSQPQPPAPSDKVARLSCVCRISELMPLVRQMHDEARARYQAEQRDERQQAA
jgi:hypothetical protein